MTLSDGVTIIDIGKAQNPASQSKEMIQAIMRTASGVKQVDNFQFLLEVYTYNFRGMTDQQYEDLLGFFINTVTGASKEFTLTDDLENAETVTFTESRLDFSRENTGADNSGMWAGSFSVEKAATGQAIIFTP